MTWPPKIGEPLPNGDSARGVHDKLARYSLEPGHPRRKAEAFVQVLAITADDVEYLARALQDGAVSCPISGIRERGDYGVHCEVIVPVRGLRDRADRVARVLTAWQVQSEGDPPRLITAYIVSRVR